MLTQTAIKKLDAIREDRRNLVRRREHLQEQFEKYRELICDVNNELNTLLIKEAHLLKGTGDEAPSSDTGDCVSNQL